MHPRADRFLYCDSYELPACRDCGDGSGDIVTTELKALEKMMADEKESEVLRQPKYVQLAVHISHMIETGVWKPGDRLPSEAEMAKSLPTSLGTIQKALGRLAEHGAIVREHYRGTFVNGPRSLLGPWHLRFLDDDGKTLLPVHQDVLGIEKVAGKEPWESFLGKSSFFVCIKRLIDVNGEFNALSFFMFPAINSAIFSKCR